MLARGHMYWATVWQTPRVGSLDNKSLRVLRATDVCFVIEDDILPVDLTSWYDDESRPMHERVVCVLCDDGVVGYVQRHMLVGL